MIIAAASTILPELFSGGGSGEPLVRTVDRGRIDGVLPTRHSKKIDRFSQLVLLAAAQLKPIFAQADKSRVGVFIGNDLAGWNYAHQQLERMIKTRDPGQIDPYVATAWFPAAAQGEITIANGILGQSKTFSAGCLSGGLALEYAAHMVAGGTLDFALAGGVEAPNAPPVLEALAVQNRISVAHPAAEAAGLVALSRSKTAGLAEVTISHPRRSAERALDDIINQFRGAMRIKYQPPSVDKANRAWMEALAATEMLLRYRFGSRLELEAQPGDGMDVGSASFPIQVIEAARSSAEGTSSLVLGCDFEGLHLACAILPVA
ncbi:beta-ketoacyl synthase N-terminal-like domain-containing protein [Mesorhizobium helmanticense]|uniref:beta-ketoacyl synthase N-terminal-like domain-containing protein n=1 Tax=Mesorhizobium helmanticense TaxID=1776423 RepID=UPI00142DE0C4|nr:beta-ketoacyl synthase N-terminal-like domain-containing protein [Mesorhizobium helmanticense]